MIMVYYNELLCGAGDIGPETTRRITLETLYIDLEDHRYVSFYLFHGNISG